MSKDKKPDDKFLQQETICDANWQVESISGIGYTIKCRVCGINVTNGGTPKCLKYEKN